MDDKKIEELLHKIKIFNETVWEHKVSRKKVFSWLGNFKDEEKTDLLFLLSQFIYFSKFQIDNMLLSIHRDFFKYSIVEEFRVNNFDTLDETLIKSHLDDVLSKTRYVPIGNPSESSAKLYYDFRTINNLKKRLFIEQSEINNLKGEDIDYFIFIDDVCGSGSQVSTYTRTSITNIKTNFPDAKIIYYTLVASQKGFDYVKSLNYFTSQNSVIFLDDTYKCFSPDSRFLKNNDFGIDVDKLKIVCEKYGYDLFKSILIRGGEDENLAVHHQLGFNDGQLMLGFHHNTPDNTLPIFWYNEDMISWNPIFERKNKVY
ncbi:hypothetical protein MP477_08860 [Chryseobacterium sp. WG23]|uniref:phosphoribosyltransferase-like protein n=1 Tax=Chryseobacterium sp. WG23 TaxID=2926910 RepID=UPI00211E60EB|nr:hypothetical protein [Chryseobacterium sp. WG23]MCQ9635061.1 hypothetical protein [Chryseobacterium sp. WG23]